MKQDEIKRLLKQGAKPIPNATYSGIGNIKIQRDIASNRVFLTCVAATAVLNRVGEIDSRELFDNFIIHQRNEGKMPELRFYHREEPMYRLGRVTSAFRDGYSYMAIAEFDLNAPLSANLISAIESHPEYWGISIGYKPRSQPELVRTDKGVVQVYNDGENHEISILPERDAASFFTAVNLG